MSTLINVVELFDLESHPSANLNILRFDVTVGKKVKQTS